MQLYATDFERYSESNPFGLCAGQCKIDEVIHNGFWFNSEGEYIGWGDLTSQNLRRISEEIGEGISFYILDEVDGHPHTINERIRRNGDFPGSIYVEQHAFMVITRGQIRFVDRSDNTHPTNLEHIRQRFKVNEITLLRP